MSRLVFLTFLFLGWAFYEVSGGMDFSVPAPVKTANVTPAAEPVTPAPEPAPALPPLPDEEALERARLVLASLPVRKLLSDQEPLGRPTLMEDLARSYRAQMPVSGEVSISGSVGFSMSQAMVAANLRMVRGNRVNMRGGPGKDYGVVATLSRGEKVELLARGDRGWVQLRVLETGEMGWMADFLLVEMN